MPTNDPNPGQKNEIRQSPSGLRRLNAAMLATAKAAETFAGLSDGEGSPGAILGAFKAAAPYLGLSPQVVHAVDWLFRFTQAGDWAPGMRPIVWPSALVQGEAFGLSPTRVKALNRHLVELGLVAMRDSPNGKRYGCRDRAGRIIEAYGFDLSPLAGRLAEFRAVAARGRAVREEMRLLRRRATIAQRGAAQIAETAAEMGLFDDEWQRIVTESRQLAKRLAKVEGLDDLVLGVAHLERRHGEARERLENLMPQSGPQGTEVRANASDPVDSDPKGAVNGPHQYNYKPAINPEQDTVIAHGKSKSVVDRVEAQSDQTVQWPEKPTGRSKQSGQIERGSEAARVDRGTVLRITPDEVVRLAPRLRPYLTKPGPNWREIVEAADWLRHDLGVSKPLWGEACVTMGREQAAIALAIVSTKPAGYFRASPGGYFHGMVAKARAGELNLGRTVWGMRSGLEAAKVRHSV